MSRTNGLDRQWRWRSKPTLATPGVNDRAVAESWLGRRAFGVDVDAEARDLPGPRTA